MKNNGSLLDKLAGAISDDEEVDWEKMDSSLIGKPEMHWVRNLRVIWSIARCHRSGEGISMETTDVFDSQNLPTRPAGTEPSFKERESANWGPLRIIERIGRGGFAEVYRARDPRLDREVALKLLNPGATERKSMVSSVLEEGRLLARLRHPNVVTVYGAEEHHGRIGLWMEFVRGRTLRELIKQQGPFGAQEAILIGLDVCRAAAAVHRAGLVHGDIKAQNVMREEGGRIVLMDFNAGRDLKREAAGDEIVVSGTPLYMAPEALEGKPATVAGDIYGIGVLLYYLVAGSYPYRGKSFTDLREAHRRGEVALLRDLRSDLPAAFTRVVERALSADPAKRFASAGQMEQALEKVLGVEGRDSAQEPKTDSMGFESRSGGGPRRIAWMGGLAAAALLLIATLPWLAGRFLPSEGPAKLEASLTDPIGSEREPQRAALSPAPAPGTATGPAISYSVQAGLFRRDGSRDEPLVPGARVNLGDEVYLEFRASEPLHVYVLNEDENGDTFVLFPLAGSNLSNPLAGSTAHRLPGQSTEPDPGTGEPMQLLWQVTSAGGKEHLLVIASPQPVEEIESDLLFASRPEWLTENRYARLSEESRRTLRGLGGVVERPGNVPPGRKSNLFARARQLAHQPEETSGIWIRQFELENPSLPEEESR